MKVAVTGASGFIGRHVLSEFARLQVETVAITRDPKPLLDQNAADHVVELDIANPGEACFERLGRPDVLVHLAWDGLPNYRSLHHFETELPRQFHFLKSMIAAGLPSLLVSGTCFEYGMQSGPLSEEMPAEPGNPYGYAKDALRKQLTFLRLAQPFSLTWARLFYLYGEGQSKGSLYPLLKDAVQRGDRVFNMSGGEQLRDYLPVAEVARQLVCLAMAQRHIGIINVCSGNPVSVRSLVEQWIRENEWKIELNLGHYPYPDYEPLAFWGDATRIRSECPDSCLRAIR